MTDYDAPIGQIYGPVADNMVVVTSAGLRTSASGLSIQRLFRGRVYAEAVFPAGDEARGDETLRQWGVLR